MWMLIWPEKSKFSLHFVFPCTAGWCFNASIKLLSLYLFRAELLQKKGKYVVNEKRLLQLFSCKCPLCGSEMKVEKFTYGVLIVLNQQCLQCEYRNQWKSQVDASVPAADDLHPARGTDVTLLTGQVGLELSDKLRHRARTVHLRKCLSKKNKHTTLLSVVWCRMTWRYSGVLKTISLNLAQQQLGLKDELTIGGQRSKSLCPHKTFLWLWTQQFICFMITKHERSMSSYSTKKALLISQQNREEVDTVHINTPHMRFSSQTYILHPLTIVAVSLILFAYPFVF